MKTVLIALALIAAKPERSISIDVKDADIHNVVRLLADTGGVNVVVPDHVAGKVTIKLRDVSWKRALEVILRAEGLGLEQDGNVIVVDTLENITRRAEARLRIDEARRKSAKLATVLIPVNYARAEELAPIVKAMLTERGSLIVDERTNTLIVTDVADDLSRVQTFLGR